MTTYLNIIKYLPYIFFLSSFLFLFNSCTGLKSLNSDEYLLYKQTIKGNKNVSSSELDNFYRQKPNEKFLNIIPYYQFYNLGKLFYNKEKYQKKLQKTKARFDEKIEKNKNDSVAVTKIRLKKNEKVDKIKKKIKEGNWLMADVGNPPVIYDSSLAAKTTEQMKNYLISHGYFNANVFHDTAKKKKFLKKILYPDKRPKKVISEYKIKEGHPYRIKNIEYAIPDHYIKKIYNEHLNQSFLKEGMVYEEENLIKERNRIENLLKSNGYYEFSRQYIKYVVDTTIKDPYKLSLKLKILNPEGKNKHEVFKINKIYLKYDVGTGQNLYKKKYDTVKYNGIHYIFDKPKYSKKILDNKIEFKKNQKFNIQDARITRKRLNELGVYKFVEVNYNKDSSNKLNAIINAYSMDKYQISDEFGLNVSQGLPGPFINLTFTNRNVFNRFEIFNFNFNYGFEGVASATEVTNVYRSQQLGSNASLTFPKLFFPFGVNKLFINNNPKTRITTSYSGIIRPEYERNNLRISMDYTLKKGNKHRYDISLINLNFLNTTRKKASFNNYLDSLRRQGSRLFESFRSSYLSNMNFSYVYNNYQMGQKTNGSYLELNSESGGTTLNFFNFNILEEALKRTGLKSIFVYYKLSGDFRYYQPLNNGNVFATKFKAGIANPYKSENDVLPYEKFFFSGGSNSIRAWQPRRLGPGSYRRLNDQGEIDYSFEQPGEVLLETSAEYRFDIVKYLEGALFIDAGNVWSIKDPVNPEKNFLWDKFYKQIAVGSGVGLRFDFSFLILRFDLGLKMWDPARPLSKRFLGDNISLRNPLGIDKQANINIGIGYPF